MFSSRPVVVFISASASYPRPLDQTSAKKFQALASLGEIFVIALSQGLKWQRFNQAAHFCLIPRLPLRPLRYWFFLKASYLIALWLVCQRGAKIFVSQSPYDGYVAAWVKKTAALFGQRVFLIVESHGDFEKFPKTQNFLTRAVVSFTIRQADAFRAISQATADQLRQRGAKKPIVQFPAWPDIDVFLKAGLMAKMAPFEPLIVFAGTLIPAKGVDYLIKALTIVSRQFPEMKLALIGPETDKNYVAELRALVKKLGLEEKVLFVGQLSQAGLAEWFSRAKIFVLPSLSEGLGRVIFEAMAAGVPVIGSNVGGIPDLIKDGQTGWLVPPADDKALAEKIIWLLTHYQKAEQVADQARQSVQHIFSPEKYVAGYKKLIKLCAV